MSKRYLNISVKASALVIMLLGFTNWKQSVVVAHKAPSIEFIHVMQDFKADSGQLIDIKDSMQIYFDGYYRVYQRPSLRIYAVDNIDKNGDFINEKVTKQERIFTYTIYNEQSKYAYSFDSISALQPRKLNLDTFLRTTINKGFDVSPDNHYRLIGAKWSVDRNTIFEQYFCTDKKNDFYADSIYYYYDKRLMDVNFSLSARLDSLKKSKLVRVRFIYNKIPKGQTYNGKTFDFDAPRRELSYEIRKNPSGESPALTNFIQLFKSKEKELYSGN